MVEAGAAAVTDQAPAIAGVDLRAHLAAVADPRRTAAAAHEVPIQTDPPAVEAFAVRIRAVHRQLVVVIRALDQALEHSAVMIRAVDKALQHSVVIRAAVQALQHSAVVIRAAVQAEPRTLEAPMWVEADRDNPTHVNMRPAVRPPTTTCAIS